MTLSSQLLQFSLFQGMSPADLMEVAGHTKLEFLKLPAGKPVVNDGDPCQRLLLLTHGTLLSDTASDDHTCHVREQLNAPYILQPLHLFGLNQRHTTTFRTYSPCNLIAIDKQELLLLLDTQLVFRLNYLNLLATEAQRLHHQSWRSAPKSLRERIIRFFFSRCLYPAGPKTFLIHMQHIADALNDSRLDISRALNDMQDDNLITLHRGRIEIPLLERLLM